MSFSMSHATDATVRSVPSMLYFNLLPPELISSITLCISPEELKAIIDSSDAEKHEVKMLLLHDTIWENLLKHHFPHCHKKLLSQEKKT